MAARFRLHDHASSAGTSVNGQPVEQCELRPGDVIRAGQTELRLVLDSPHQQSTLVQEPAAPARPALTAGSLKNLVGQGLAHFELKKILGSGNTGLVFLINHFGTRGMLDWRTSFLVAVQIARALETAYEHQIIHRNITPTNILFSRELKQAKLGDLMLAKALEGTQARQITRPGQLVGELPYMPPERTRTDVAVDCRSDIYSLGATIYALLTGRPPFEANSVPELVSLIRSAEPAKPKQYHLSIADRFQDCVLTMLAKRPEDRYETPSKLLMDLNRIARYEGISV